MNKEKLTTMSNDVTAKIHTAEIITKSKPIDNRVDYFNDVRTTLEDDATTKTTIQLNLNKYNGKDVFEHGKYEEYFKSITTVQNIQDSKFNRVDFAFDTYSVDDYKKYFKLNNYLLLLMACKFKTTNNYRTQDLFIPETHSIAIKNKTIEVENYDKVKESNGKSKVTNRLELRRKDMLNKKSLNTPSELHDYWCSVLDDLPNYMDILLERENDAIMKFYAEHKKDASAKWTNTNGFIALNSDNIFSSKQLTDLYSRLGKDNPKEKAKKYKYRNKLEYINKGELETYINILKYAMQNYFEN